MRRRVTLLAQLETRQLLTTGSTCILFVSEQERRDIKETYIQTSHMTLWTDVDRCDKEFSVHFYLLVVLWVVVSDCPGSGSDHPTPHSLPVLLRHAAT